MDRVCLQTQGGRLAQVCWRGGLLLPGTVHHLYSVHVTVINYEFIFLVCNYSCISKTNSCNYLDLVPLVPPPGPAVSAAVLHPPLPHPYFLLLEGCLQVILSIVQ